MGLSRILKEDLQFSIGPRLPKGTIVCVYQHHIHNSETLYPDPEVFDPQRFLRMRSKPGHETRHQYTNNGPDLLTWGDGPQVCPGRVFAGNTIKILLSQLLLNYDIQYPLGTGKPPRLSFRSISGACFTSQWFEGRTRVNSFVFIWNWNRIAEESRFCVTPREQKLQAERRANAQGQHPGTAVV